jgi:DNA-binding MarR family transcriptional regulator
VDQWFIEQMGLFAESDGLTRIGGRMFGALLVSEIPRSLDELAESLGVSKASVSTDARRLLERGIVERVAHPGDRRDYYQLAPDFFALIMRHRVQRWATLHDLAAEMELRNPGAPTAVQERFAYLAAVHAFVLARLDDALDEWQAAWRSHMRAVYADAVADSAVQEAAQEAVQRAARGGARRTT